MSAFAVVLGFTLLHSLWQGALLALAVCALLPWLPRRDAAWRYRVACAALLALPLWMALTAWHLAAGATAAPLLAAAEPGVRFSSLGWVSAAAPFLALGWGAGVALHLLRWLLGWRHLGSLCRTALPLSGDLGARAAELAASLGLAREVPVFVSARLTVPLAVGVLRPVVLLPLAALTNLTPLQLELILLHELAHIRRGDALLNLLQSLVELLCFYHPAVWLLAALARREREHCCDDAVLRVSRRSPLAYARALERLERARPLPRTLAPSATGGQLMNRIRRLVRPDPAPPLAARLGSLALLCLALGACADRAPLASGLPLEPQNVCFSAQVYVGEHPVRAFGVTGDRVISGMLAAHGLTPVNCGAEDLKLEYRVEFRAQADERSWRLRALDPQGATVWEALEEDAIPSEGAFQYAVESGAERLLSRFLAAQR